MEYADWTKLFVGSAESSCHGHQLWNQFCSDQIFVAECKSDIGKMPVEPGTGCSEIMLTVNTLSFSDNIQEKALLFLRYCNHLSVLPDMATKKKTTLYLFSDPSQIHILYSVK
jgi:hypothetical protein